MVPPAAARRARELLRTGVVLLAGALLPLCALAGSLRVGPTRVDLSTRHPVAVLEVQNTGDSPTLTQLDMFSWTQQGAGDELEVTTELIATPMVMSLTPGETRVVRIGLRAPNHAGLEKSYRLFVREVTPTFVERTGLQFALRIGVPVFAVPGDARFVAGGTPAELGWRWAPDIQGCASVQVENPSERHERVLGAEMLAANGEVLWKASEPAYVLAGARRSLQPAICAPSVKEAAKLRLITEDRTLTLPAIAPSLILDASAH